MSYNGWSNYETWRVNLEMIDGKELGEFVEVPDLIELMEDESARYDYIKHVAYVIRDFCETLIEEESTKGIARDLALSFLDKADWYEIAEHLCVDAA